MKNQGDGRRVAKVEQEVQKTVAQYLITGFRRPLQGLVTVSRVIMPGDLRTAKVYISVLGSDEQRQQTIEVLQKNAHEVQKFIGKELRMRYCPKLEFYADHTTDQVLKIDRILTELNEIKALQDRDQDQTEDQTED